MQRLLMLLDWLRAMMPIFLTTEKILSQKILATAKCHMLQTNNCSLYIQVNISHPKQPWNSDRNKCSHSLWVHPIPEHYVLYWKLNYVFKICLVHHGRHDNTASHINITFSDYPKSQVMHQIYTDLNMITARATSHVWLNHQISLFLPPLLPRAGLR